MGIRLLPLLALLMLASIAPAKPGASRVETRTPPTEVRFVIFGDSQFANHDVFERMAHEVDMLRPHFVIQVGDLINGYTHDRTTARAEWDTFRGQIAPLSMPFYPVPGNHDVVTPELQEVFGEIWGSDRYTYSFTWGNVHCIVLNSFWADAESKDHDRIGQWQKDWLARDLAEYKELHGGDITGHSIFVFLHSPLWRYADTHPGRQDWDEIHAILQQYPVKLVTGGHTHEHVWEQQDGVDYLVLNSSGGGSRDNERGGMFHAYLHVSVVGDDVRFATLKAGSILPLDTVDSQDRRTFPRHSLRSEMLTVEGWVPGQPLDTQVTVPVHNPLKEARRYRLDWRIPFGADITAEPSGTWLELAPDESRELTFRLLSPAAPSLDQRPSLEVSATDVIRTGIVDRATEAAIRAQREDAGADPAAFRTQVRLDEPTTFSARHTLFVPPVAKAAPLAGAITLDGILDEAAWQAATPVDDFANASDERGNRTIVRFLYDADHLYVGAWLGEPNPAGVKADANPSTPMAFTWDDDDFELFFDAAVTRREYSRLFINNAGTRFNSRPREWAEEKRYFESKYESAIHLGEDHWSIEMRIPWTDMNAPRPAAAGDRWGIMIARHRQQQPDARIQWRGPTGTGMYDPRQYGMLVFE